MICGAATRGLREDFLMAARGREILQNLIKIFQNKFLYAETAELAELADDTELLRWR